MSKKNKTGDFKFIDLFAGIGGMRIGVEKSGGICVFSSEWDSSCQKTYETFHGHKPFGDITKEEVKDKIPDNFNILVAGFPCQPFSSIGRRQGFKHPTQGTLFHEVVKILDKHKPEAFLLENVAGLVSHDEGNTYKIILETLDKISPTTGYWVSDRILNASDFGVPQIRKRIYIVGFRKDLASAYSKEEAFLKLGFSFDNLRKKTKTYINRHLERGVSDRSVTNHLQKVYIHKVKDGRPQILEHSKKQVSNTLVASYYKIQRLTGIFVKDGPTGLRLLTENECRAIMGFPKISKKFPPVPVSRTQMYKQYGNSVAVPVIEKISKEIFKTLKNIS